MEEGVVGIDKWGGSPEMMQQKNEILETLDHSVLYNCS